MNIPVITISSEISIINLASVVLSIVAIAFTAISLGYQRRHDRLTFKPIPKLHFLESPISVKIVLENLGNGPLILKSTCFLYPDKKSIKLDELIKEINSNFKLFYSAMGINMKAAVVLPGKDFIIIELKNNSKNVEMLLKFTELLKDLSKITISISYTDIYEKKIKNFTEGFSFVMEQYEENIEILRKAESNNLKEFTNKPIEKN